jgi:hypothetical protein
MRSLADRLGWAIAGAGGAALALMVYTWLTLQQNRSEPFDWKSVVAAVATYCIIWFVEFLRHGLSPQQMHFLSGVLAVGSGLAVHLSAHLLGNDLHVFLIGLAGAILPFFISFAWASTAY